MRPYILASLLAVPMLALAGQGRVNATPLVSTPAMFGTNSSVSHQVAMPNGGELREVEFYGFSSGTTVAVTRVSSDLTVTSAVTSVISVGGTNATVTLNNVETARLFALYDYFVATSSYTGITFKLRPRFLAFDP